MAILGHGSDLTLAATVAPIISAAGGTVTNALGRLSKLGFGAVQLDATLRGIRPRELDKRARRDLAALLSRRGVRLAGIDLFIPRRHYVDPHELDRAMSATIGAITLAADLGRVPVSLGLPVAELTEETRDALVEAADGHGVRLAVHAEGRREALTAWLEDVDLPILGAGLDPAAVIGQGKSPADAANDLSDRLAVARLADAVNEEQDEGNTRTTRVPVGRGELDVIAYRVSLDLASGRSGPVVLDLRGLSEPVAAAQSAKQTWDDAAFTV